MSHFKLTEEATLSMECTVEQPVGSEPQVPVPAARISSTVFETADQVYLDYNSTTPLAPEVVLSISASLSADWANPSSDSELGRRARDTVEAARRQLADMINAESPKHIVFTSGGTESNNMAILSAVECGRQASPTPHVVLSNVEHVATSAYIRRLVEKGLIDSTEAEVNRDGCLECSAVTQCLRPSTALVTVMMANNETGVLFPVQQIARELKLVNAKHNQDIQLHVDAAQAIGKVPVDVQELGVDYLTIVGHKLYGPRIGALYVRRVECACPVVWGGGQEGGLRPGTENTPMICGLGCAADLVTRHLSEDTTRMARLRDHLLRRLKEGTQCIVNCENSPRLPNTLSVSWPDCRLSGYQLLELCPRLVASTTAACHDQQQLSEVLLRSGVPRGLAVSTVRLSVGRPTTPADIDIAADQLIQALNKSKQEHD